MASLLASGVLAHGPRLICAHARASGSDLAPNLADRISRLRSCHAPTCLQIDLYTCDKGTALDKCNATTGKLACRVKPVYGDAGNPAIHNTRFSEPGFIAIPDCFWGKAENGLEPPLNLTDVPLHVVKKCNATEGHYGEMSGGQPWVIV